MLAKCFTLHMFLVQRYHNSKRELHLLLSGLPSMSCFAPICQNSIPNPNPSEGAAWPPRSAVLNINDFANRQTSDEEPYDQYEVSVPLQSAGACLKQARM